MEKWDYCIQGQGHSKGKNVSECPDDIFSVCPIVSAQYLLNYSTIFDQIWYGVYYHQAMCLAEKLVHHLQCQGHSKGLYNQSMTILVVSSKLLVSLRTNLV